MLVLAPVLANGPSRKRTPGLLSYSVLRNAIVTWAFSKAFDLMVGSNSSIGISTTNSVGPVPLRY